MRGLYERFKDTTESEIEYGCLFGADKAYLEAHPGYNTLAHNRKKLLSSLEPVSEKTEENLLSFDLTKIVPQ